MNCPYCAEEIKDDAVVCRYCRSPLFYAKPVMDDIRQLKTQLGDLAQLVAALSARLDEASPETAPAAPGRSRVWGSIAKIAAVNLILAVILTTSESTLVNGCLLFGTTLVLGAWTGAGTRRLRFVKYLLLGAFNIVAAILGRIIVDLMTGFVSSRYDRLQTMYHSDYFFLAIALFVVAWILAFMTGAYSGGFIERLAHPRRQGATMANRLAANLVPASGGGSAQPGQARAQTFVATLIALLPPLCTLAGTVAAAYFGYLAALKR